MDGSSFAPRATLEDLLAHSGWVRGLARSLVTDADTADDLVQETWLAALQRPPQKDRPLRPWLAQVVRNFARQRSRGEGRRRAREAEHAGPAALPSPDELVERVGTQQRVARAVVALPEPYRSTILLRYFEGLETREIARRQGVPEAAVRQRQKRGLDRLRDELDRRWDGNRGAWSAALVTLAQRLPEPAAAAPLASTLLTGVLAVKGFAQIALALSFLGLIVIGIGSYVVTHRIPDARPELVSAREAVSFRAPATSGEGAVAAPEVEGSRRVAAQPGPGDVGGADVARARLAVADESGAPLPSVRVLQRGSSRALAVTDAEGHAALELPLEPDEAGREVELRLELAGFVPTALEAALARGETRDLGTWTLVRAGALAGRVVDRSGAPIADAVVHAARPDVMLFDNVGPVTRGRPDGTLASTTTDGTGEFALGGLEPGFVRVWAGAEDKLFACSGMVEIRRGSEAYGLVLTLSDMPSTDQLGGVVLDPDGRPVPHAQVRVRHDTLLLGSGMTSFPADSEGRFRLRLRVRTDHEVRAEDPQGRWRGALVERVAPGTLELELRLGELRTVTLHARGTTDTDLERFRFAVEEIDLDGGLGNTPQSDHAEGPAQVHVPMTRFRVRVSARGHDEVVLGPFLPDAVPDPLVARLRPLPGVVGQVVANGEPVPGADVTLHAELGALDNVEVNGFPQRMQYTAAARDTTDDQGRFLLTLRESGRYWLRAEAEGLAPTLLEPRAFDAQQGHSGLVVELTPGGALEGRVLVPAGDAPGGVVIGATNGDGHPRTVRTDADGWYRFERLTPGEWRVERRTELLRPGQTSISTGTSMLPQRWEGNCHVHEGQVTRFDFDLSEGSLCRLRGSFALDGDAPAGWTVELTAGGGVLEDGRRMDVATIAPDGGYQLAAVEPGTYCVRFRPPRREGGDAHWTHAVRLEAGDNRLDTSFRLGRIEGRVEGSGGRPLAALWDFGDGRAVALPILPAADGTFAVDAVPAGRAELVGIPDEPAARGPEPPRPVALGEVEVPAGGVGRFDG